MTKSSPRSSSSSTNSPSGHFLVKLALGGTVALLVQHGGTAWRWCMMLQQAKRSVPTEIMTPPAVTFWPQGTGTEVVPFFLQQDDDAALLTQLANRSFWGQDGMDSQWWPHPSAATIGDDPWRQVAWKIYRHHPLLDRAVGIEYWTNVITAQTPLDWHIDKDESVDEEHLVSPLWGSVYYGYPHSFRGGYLEILVGGAYEVFPDAADGEVERIRADYNRLVRFNASLWHRVSPLTDDNGERLALAVNLWHVVPKTFAD